MPSRRVNVRELWRCSAVDLHAGSLYDAVRASEAFPIATREIILHRFERADALLTPSHAIELARVTPHQRAKGIEALLRAPLSVRELRRCLRTTSCDSRTFAETRGILP